MQQLNNRRYFMFQHTAARRRLLFEVTSLILIGLFQHTAARRRLLTFYFPVISIEGFQHTAARRRLRNDFIVCLVILKFQHTAARRRLHQILQIVRIKNVSTHSRAKAAALSFFYQYPQNRSFNTQPREGGCFF